MKRRKRVVAFVSALLTLMYGTVPSFGTFAEDENTLQPVAEVSVSVEEEAELSAENEIVIDAVEEFPLVFEPVEEESPVDESAEGTENQDLDADNSTAVLAGGGLMMPQEERPADPLWSLVVNVIYDEATVYVPYSFLLKNIPNTGTTTPTTNPNVPTTEPTTEPTTPTNPATNSDENIAIPSNLEIVNKGSEGIFSTNYFSDDSLIVDGIVDSVGNAVTVPSSVNGYPVRAIRIVSGYLSFFWQNAKQITVPSGVAFLVNKTESGYETVSASEAVRLFQNEGITLVVDGSNSVANNNQNAGALEDHNGYNTAESNTETSVSRGNVSDSVINSNNTVMGRLPDGLSFYPESTEIYGVPREYGTFIFSLNDIENSIYTTGDGNALPADYQYLYDYTFQLTVLPNTNIDVYNQTDVGYSILQPIGVDQGGYDFVLDPVEDTVFRSEGEFSEFVNLWLNGQLLERGVDYEAESGSTVMTIYAKTFENKAKADSVNTIAAEFRTTDPNSLNTINDTNGLRVTAQNFRFSSSSIASTPKVETVYEENSAPSDNTPSVSVSNNTSTPSVSSSNNNSSTPSSKSDTSSNASSNADTADHTPYSLYVTAGILALLGIGFTFPHKRKNSAQK